MRSERIGGIGLTMFLADELSNIHLSTLDLLRTKGVKVFNEDALAIYDGGGCVINKQEKNVKIPTHIVEDAIHSCPSTFRLGGRTSEKDFIFDNQRVGFASCGSAINVIDPYTRKVRRCTKQDLIDSTRLKRHEVAVKEC